MDVPNAPRTPVRSVRVPDELWEELQRVADDKGETVTDVILRACRREVREHPSRGYYVSDGIDLDSPSD